MFSYWDSDIHGIYTTLVPDQLIEQDWYGHDHPERKFKAIFTFEANGNTTIVNFVFAGEIEDEEKDRNDFGKIISSPEATLNQKLLPKQSIAQKGSNF